MKRCFFIILILQSLFSCMKEEIDVNKVSPNVDASPSLTLPLVYGSVSIDDFLNNNQESNDISIFTDTDNLLHLKYSSVLDSFNIADFVDNVPNQDTSVTFTSGSLPNSGFDFSTSEFNNYKTVESTKSLYYTLKPGSGEEFLIDSGTVKSGILKFQVNSDFKATGEYKIELPFVKSPTGEVLSVVFSSTDESSYAPKLIDISGYSISLIDENGNPNKIKIDYSLNVKRSSLPITDGTNLQCIVTTQDLAFEEAYGYIGQYVLDVDLDTVKLDFNNQFADAEIYLGDPKFTLEIDNSFGIPMRITLDPNMKAILNDQNDIPFVINPLYNPKDIAYPSISEIGSVKNDEISINNETSNIADIIAAMPDELTFGAKFEINPDNDLTKYNFVAANSYLKASLALDLPFDLELKNIVYSDTLDMDLNETISNLEDVEQLELDLNLDNGLPIQLKAQVYFYEQKSENDNSMALLPIDSLIHDNNALMIEAASTTNGMVVSSTNTFQNVSITGERLQTLKNTKYAVMKIFIETDQPGVGTIHNPVKILSTNKFSFKIGAKASAQVKVE